MKRLANMGKAVELIVYEDEGHAFLKLENVLDSETAPRGISWRNISKPIEAERKVMIRFSVLDENEVEAIHLASLRILGETGVVLERTKKPRPADRVREPNYKRSVSEYHLNWWKSASRRQERRQPSVGEAGRSRHLVMDLYISITWEVRRRSSDAASGIRRHGHRARCARLPPVCWMRWRIAIRSPHFLRRPKCQVG